MAKAVLDGIPVGTPIADAEKFMASEGFKCSATKNDEWRDRTGLDYLYCDRSEGTGLVRRRWQVAVVHVDGKVTEVLTTTGLIGP